MHSQPLPLEEAAVHPPPQRPLTPQLRRLMPRTPLLRQLLPLLHQLMPHTPQPRRCMPRTPLVWQLTPCTPVLPLPLLLLLLLLLLAAMAPPERAAAQRRQPTPRMSTLPLPPLQPCTMRRQWQARTQSIALRASSTRVRGG